MKMINSISKRLLLVAALLLGFLPLPLFMQTDDLFMLLNAMTVVVGVAVIIAYLPGSMSWVWDRPKTTAGHLLVIGITVSWLANIGRVSWLWAWRLSGQPDDVAFFNHWFLAVTLYILIIGGSLHLLAHRAIDDKVPMSGWVTLLLATMIGLIIGFGVILTRST